MKRIIIGITGLARSGKTTASNFLVEEKNFHQISFAWALKRACSAMYGVHISKFFVGDRLDVDPFWKITYREMLQKVGTDMVRNHIDPDFWVKRVAQQISRMDNNKTPVVIPDVRFENEATWVREQGGIIIRLVSESSGLPGDLGKHISESGIAFNNNDFIVENHFSPENPSYDRLYSAISSIVDFAKAKAEATDGQ